MIIVLMIAVMVDMVTPNAAMLHRADPMGWMVLIMLSLLTAAIQRRGDKSGISEVRSVLDSDKSYSIES